MLSIEKTDVIDLDDGPIGILDEARLRDVIKAIGFVIESDCEPESANPELCRFHACSDAPAHDRFCATHPWAGKGKSDIAIARRAMRDLGNMSLIRLALPSFPTL